MRAYRFTLRETNGEAHTGTVLENATTIQDCFESLRERYGDRLMQVEDKITGEVFHRSAPRSQAAC